jgi:peptidoglycan/LPS O-acetylase OafA/YrhL
LKLDFPPSNAVSPINAEEVLIVRSTDRPSHPEHVPALDGIRGFGFLAVFLGHTFRSVFANHRSSILGNSLYHLQQIEWLAVPAFFVLSGYLIGGNLFRTRNREGFFLVFYYRRMLRVLPVYYVTLLAVAAVKMTHGVHLDYRFWSHFIYIQNFMPGYSSDSYAYENIRHLWSLAIEEQFYLTWPLIVWFAKDRATLLKVIAFLCAACWTIRLASPWIHLSSNDSYFSTLTRVDTILFGVALALITDHALYKRFQPFAKYGALAGIALWLISFSTHADHPENYYRVAVEYSLANFTVVMIIAAVLEEGGGFARACSARWACWLGSMTYGLYIFHYLYLGWLHESLRGWLLGRVSPHLATVITVTIALAGTIALAMVSYRFLEQPALSLKKYVKYGPERRPKTGLSRAPIAAFTASPE